MKNQTDKQETPTLLEVCESIPDPRTNRITKFDWVEVLFSAVTAVLAGANTFREIAEFAADQLDWMRQYLAYDNGTPSAGTYRDAFKKLDGAQLHESFAAWADNAQRTLRAADVRIADRKTPKDPSKPAFEPRGVVGAVATAAEPLRGEIQVAEENAGGAAAPDLLTLLDINGLLVPKKA